MKGQYGQEMLLQFNLLYMDAQIFMHLIITQRLIQMMALVKGIQI